MERSIEPVPIYALAYLVNADPSGLTDDDIREIDQAVETLKIHSVIPRYSEDEADCQPYFSSMPLFGLPTEVEDCTVLFNI